MGPKLIFMERSTFEDLARKSSAENSERETKLVKRQSSTETQFMLNNGGHDVQNTTP